MQADGKKRCGSDGQLAKRAWQEEKRWEERRENLRGENMEGEKKRQGKKRGALDLARGAATLCARVCSVCHLCPVQHCPPIILCKADALSSLVLWTVWRRA